MIESRRFIPLLGVVGLLIVAQQAFDIAQLLPSTDLATPVGRVRQLVALESRTPGLLTGDVLVLWALIAAGSRMLLRSAGGLHLLVGVLVLVLAPVFLRDAGSVVGGLSGNEAAAFRVVVARTLAVLALLGAAGLVAGRYLVVLPGETSS